LKTINHDLYLAGSEFEFLEREKTRREPIHAKSDVGFEKSGKNGTLSGIPCFRKEGIFEWNQKRKDFQNKR